MEININKLYHLNDKNMNKLLKFLGFNRQEKIVQSISEQAKNTVFEDISHETAEKMKNKELWVMVSVMRVL